MIMLSGVKLFVSNREVSDEYQPMASAKAALDRRRGRGPGRRGGLPAGGARSHRAGGEAPSGGGELPADDIRHEPKSGRVEPRAAGRAPDAGRAVGRRPGGGKELRTDDGRRAA